MIKYWIAIIVLVCVGCRIGESVDSVNGSREQILSSGNKVKITGLNLAFGDRASGSQDVMVLSYQTLYVEKVSSDRNKEAHEVFELIRPLCEQWRLSGADLMAFQKNNGKGDFWAIRFRRGTDGRWNAEEMPGKVY